MKRITKFARRIIRGLLEDAFEHESRNILRRRQGRALEETVDFIEEFLPLVQSFDSRYSLMRHCAQEIRSHRTDGMICEFGVAGGKSINFLAKLFPEFHVYGFDSFAGLPENWRDGVPQGSFRVERLPKVESNVTLVPGWFSESLPSFFSAHTEPIALAHIDCDLYSSAKTVLTAIAPFLRHGSILIFDEFFNYPGWKKGEYLAFCEFIEDSERRFEYLGYNRYGTQVAVRLLD